MEEQERQTLNKAENPDGILIKEGKIKLFGYSERPPEGQPPAAIAGSGPVRVTLEPRRYSWCTCGHSMNQPWCDNQHREEKYGTERKSYKFEVLEEITISLCMCKQTKNPPFCDGTHNAVCERLKEEHSRGKDGG